jgi:septal ring-binding cell division protein DamX
MRVQSAGSGVVHDSQWLLQQNPKAYTVQLVMSPSQADMARFIDRNAEAACAEFPGLFGDRARPA